MEKLEEKLLSEDQIESLPKGKHPDGTFLSFYHGFWCPTKTVNPFIAFQQHFVPHESDIIIASFPKSGTTWLKALAFTIVKRDRYMIADHPLLKTNPHYLVLSLEQHFYRAITPQPELGGLPRPRVLSTHVPYAALPSSIKDSNCKILYICRNPIDQFISYYLFEAKLGYKNNSSVSIEEIFEKYCQGTSQFGPFWNHILGYYKASLEFPDKILFLKYEDLKADTINHIKLLAKFLGFPFSDEEEKDGVVGEVLKLCSFEHLKNLEINKSGKHATGHDNSDFFRKGKVGDGSNYLTPSQVDTLQKIIQEKFRGSGLEFQLF